MTKKIPLDAFLDGRRKQHCEQKPSVQHREGRRQKRSDRKTGLMIGRKERGEEKTEEWKPTMNNSPFVSANLLG